MSYTLKDLTSQRLLDILDILDTSVRKAFPVCFPKSHATGRVRQRPCPPITSRQLHTPPSSVLVYCGTGRSQSSVWRLGLLPHDFGLEGVRILQPIYHKWSKAMAHSFWGQLGQHEKQSSASENESTIFTRLFSQAVNTEAA